LAGPARKLYEANDMPAIPDLDWWFIVPLGLAVLFGGLIGGERQTHGRSAGLRTHVLVCLGSTIIIIAFQPGGSDKGILYKKSVSSGLLSMTFVIRYKDENLGPRVVDNLSGQQGIINVSWK